MWQAVEPAYTASSIASALDADELMMGPEGIYSSTEMKSNLNAEMLAASFILKNLLTLDSRGGYFSQKDMRRAVMLKIESSGRANELLRFTTPDLPSTDDVITILAYKLRTMCTHVRTSFDNTTDKK